MSRLRITVSRTSYLLHVLAVLFVLLISGAHCLADDLIIGSNKDGHWLFELTGSSISGGVLVLAQPGCPGLTRTVAANGAIRITNPAGDLCGSAAFTTVPIPAWLNASTRATYDDGKGFHQAFTFPPVGAVTQSHPAVPTALDGNAAVINDDTAVTVITTVSTARATLTASARDEAGNTIPVEFWATIQGPDGKPRDVVTNYCDAAPPASQCRVLTRLTVGTLTLTEPSNLFGQVQPDVKVSCLATVSRPDGGNASVLPCR
jgi:hypothetical protein